MGLFDSITGGYTQAPMTTAGKYLFDQTQSLSNQAGSMPTNKILFGGNTFEVLPKADKDRIKLQLAILGALGGTQQNQTLDPGLLGRLAPALGLAAGNGLFKNLFNTTGTTTGGNTPIDMSALNGIDWSSLFNTASTAGDTADLLGAMGSSFL